MSRGVREREPGEEPGLEAPDLPWWPDKRGGALDLDEIAGAATALIDEGGVAHLTMRRLAERLDVAPMGLYWYVANRDELLAVVRDAAFAPVVATLVTDAGWRGALRSVALGLHEIVVDRPNLLPIVDSDDYLPGPNVLTMIDSVLRALLDDGVTGYDASWAFQLVASTALDRPAEPAQLGLLAGEGLERFDALTSVMAEFAERPAQEQGRSTLFEATLDAALAGIASRLDRGDIEST